MIIAEDAPIRVLIRNHLDFKGKVSRKRYLHFRLFSILPICLIIWLQHLASQGGPQALEYTIASCLIALLLIPVDFSYMIRALPRPRKIRLVLHHQCPGPQHLVRRPGRRNLPLLERENRIGA